MNAQPSRPGISLRALAPNAVTALALCTGLSGAWFAMQGRWENAVAESQLILSMAFGNEKAVNAYRKYLGISLELGT
jgi:hypothetical protein